MTIKRISGAAAALLLAFGGASFANERAVNANTAAAEAVDSSPPLEYSIPVSEAAIAEDVPTSSEAAISRDVPTHTVVAEPAPDFISEAVIQDISNAPPEQTSTTRARSEKETAFVIKRILPIEGPIKYGEWYWDDEGVPDGKIIMTVDLEARVLSVFKGGYEIGATAVLLGTQEHPTPLGVFPILQKKKDNISSIYDVPMPYTLRLTWDGISIHSTEVENGYASHGCIGTPDPFAAKLFALADKGDKVIITRGRHIGMGDKIL